MAGSVGTLDPLAARWRAATLLAAAIAAVELGVIVVLGAAVAGRRLTAQTATATPRATAHDRGPARRAKRLRVTVLPRSKTSVLVLNGNGRTGAAATMATLVRARGYRIGGVGNASRSDYARSLVMYRRGFGSEAARLARDMHLRVVGPLDGISRGALGRAHLALVVGH